MLVSRSETDSDAFSALASVLRYRSVFDVLVDHHSPILESLYSQQLQHVLSQTSDDHASSTSDQQGGHDQQPEFTALPGFPHLLSSRTSVPSAYHPYLESLIRGYQQEPLSQWLERLYGFFAHATLEVLSGIDESVIHLSIQRWTTLMRSESCVENLYAAYVACRLQRHTASLLGNDSSPGSCPVVCPTLRAWIGKCYALFQRPQNVETVRSTLARVLKLTCTESCRGLRNAGTAVALAGDVLAVSRHRYSGTWEEDTKPYARKLAQKFGGMEAQLQLAAIHVLAVLDCSAWNFEAVHICHKGLRLLAAAANGREASPHPQARSAEILLQAADQCMSLSLTDQSVHVFAPFVKDLFNFVIEQCSPNHAVTPDRLRGLAQGTRFMDALQALDQTGASVLSTQFLQVAEELGIPDWWTLDMTSPGSPENCCGLPACVHFAELQRQKLCNQVSLLLMSSGCGEGRQLPRSTIELLAQRLSQGCLGNDRAACTYRPFVRSQQAPANEQQPHLNSHNWRDYLSAALESSSSEVYHSTETLIAMVCKDLEDRCDNVEVPLRAANAKVQELNETVQQLQNQISSVTSDKDRIQEALQVQQEARNHDTALTTELQQSISSLEQQLQDGQQQIHNLKTDKAETDEQHQQKLLEIGRTAQQDLETAQDQHSITVMQLEAQIASHAQANSSLETESAWLKDQAEQMRDELLATHAQEIEHLQAQHAEEAESQNRQILQLQETASDAARELRCLSTDLQARDQSIASLTHQRDEHADQISTLRTSLATTTAEKSSIQAQLTEAQTTNRDLSRATAASDAEELSRRARRIADLEASEARLQWRAALLDRALADAKRREEGISALLLAGRAAGRPARRSSPREDQMDDATATGTSSQGLEQRNLQPQQQQQQQSVLAPPPRLSEGSFISNDYDDDEDYYEIMKLGE